MAKEKKSSHLKPIEDFGREKNKIGTLNGCAKYCRNKTCFDIKGLGKVVQELTLCNQELQSENNRVGQRVEELEQYARGNIVEIEVVPVTGNLSEILKKHRQPGGQDHDGI